MGWGKYLVPLLHLRGFPVDTFAAFAIAAGPGISGVAAQFLAVGAASDVVTKACAMQKNRKKKGGIMVELKRTW